MCTSFGGSSRCHLRSAFYCYIVCDIVLFYFHFLRKSLLVFVGFLLFFFGFRISRLYLSIHLSRRLVRVCSHSLRRCLHSRLASDDRTFEILILFIVCLNQAERMGLAPSRTYQLLNWVSNSFCFCRLSTNSTF